MTNPLEIEIKFLKLQLLLSKVKEYDAPWLNEKKSVCRNEDGSFASCSDTINSNENTIKTTNDLGLGFLPKNIKLPNISFFNSNEFNKITDNLSEIIHNSKENINSTSKEIIKKGKDILKNEKFNSAQEFLDNFIKSSLDELKNIDSDTILGLAGAISAFHSAIIINALTGSLVVTGFSAVATGLGLFFMGNLLNSLIKDIEEKKTKEEITKKLKNINKISKQEKKELLNDPKINEINKLLFKDDTVDSKLASKILKELNISSPQDLIDIAINLKKSNLDIVPLINNAIEDEKYSFKENQFDLTYRINSLNKLHEKNNLSKKEKRLKEVNEDILKADIEYGDNIRKITKVKSLEQKMIEASKNGNESKRKELTSNLRELSKKINKKELYNKILFQLSNKSNKDHITVKPLEEKILDFDSLPLPISKGLVDILGKSSFDKRLMQLIAGIMPAEKIPKLEEINFNKNASTKSKRSLRYFNDLIGRDINVTLADIETRGRAFSSPLGNLNLLKINVGGVYQDENMRRGVIYHEASHAIESQNPEVLERSKEYLFDRARAVSKNKEKEYNVIQALKSISIDKEYALDGGFIRAYTGKIYSHQSPKSVISNGLSEEELLPVTEILSTGAESLAYRRKFEHDLIRDKDHILYTLSALHERG